MRRVNFPLWVPEWLYQPVHRWRTRRRPAQNLEGDRDVEWSYVSARMPEGPGEALEVGAGGSPLSLVAALKGFQVTAIDLWAAPRPYELSALEDVEGDLLTLPLPEGRFDLVINCSAIEHVGLSGRYGVAVERPEGDLEAMARLRSLLRPGGLMVMTIPVGVDAVFRPFCRVYGEARLPRLLEGYEAREERYFVKRKANRWQAAPRALALSFPARVCSEDPRENAYALGCFVLAKPSP
ncbi:MAG: DUF268 domain-containing protein [Myxococcales bacterium]|nr:DUF268 domain-containing protein [Myxococcales bacterium]